MNRHAELIQAIELADHMAGHPEFAHVADYYRDQAAKLRKELANIKHYFIRVQHMDGAWYKPGKLLRFNAATREFAEPVWFSVEDAQAQITATYGDCLPGTVEVIRLPVPKDAVAKGLVWTPVGVL